MDLRTGKSVWEADDVHVFQYPKLEQDAVCDVLIIGGGVSGALMAYMLTKQGKFNVILVDKRAVATGSSAANTGLVQMSNDQSLVACRAAFGESRANRFYQLCQQAIDDLDHVCSQLPQRTEFRRRSSLYAASNEQDATSLHSEYEALKSIGFQVEYWDRSRINRHFSFDRLAGIYTKDDAEVNPYAMAQCLLEASLKQGLSIYNHTPVHEIDSSDHMATFKAGPHRIKAKYAIYATGYEAHQRNDTNASLSSTFAIATQPISDFSKWYERCLIWETARPYLYMRTTLDNRIIIGGLDEETPNAADRQKLLLRKQAQLVQQLQAWFPHMELKAEYAWAGVFGSTRDGMPLIGAQSAASQRSIIMGYGGNGIVYSMIAAKLITEQLITGTMPEDLALFTPTRFRPDSSNV